MKTLKLIFLFCATFPLTALSQTNYRAGYVIKNNGDTLKGYINYREWNESPKAIQFKQNIADKQPVVFDVPAIKSFQITGYGNYIGYTGPVTTGKTNTIAGLSPSLDTAVRLDSAFLKVISKGENVQLLYHNDQIKYRYFILETNSAKPYELKFYQYLEDGNRIISQAPFTDQIDLLLKKYNNSSINATGRVSVENYNEDILMRYVKIINNNKTTEQSRSSGFRFFAGVAAAYTVASFDGPSGFGYPSHASTVLPGINAGVDFLTDPDVQKSFFRAEISMTGISPTFTGTVSTFSSTQYIVKVAGKYIFNVYNTDKFKYYIGGGAAFTNTFVANSKLVATQSGVIVTSTYLQPLGNSYASLKTGQSITDPYELGEGGLEVQLRTGIVLNKKIEIYLEAAPFSFGLSSGSNPSNPIFTSASYSYKNYTTSLGFDYLFGSK